MTSWGGNGLVPPAQARIERFQRSPVHTSLISVPSAVSLESVGFDIVGDVFGSAVMSFGWYAAGNCGWGYGNTGPARIYGTNSRWNGYGRYVQRVMDGYRRALSRLTAEAAGIGADGVVGVRLSSKTVAEGAHEYLALGTAVRARSRHRPSKPFTTDLWGSDVAKLLLSGWVPMSLEMAMEVAIRHDDYLTLAQERSSVFNQANVEVTGCSELAAYTRDATRRKLAAKIGSAGADGVVVSSLTFDMRVHEVDAGHSDHVAESMIVGTAVGSFRTRRSDPPPSPLTILPLRPR